MPTFGTPTRLLALATSTPALQASLVDTGRFLLKLAMALVVAYLVFVLGSVLVAAVTDRLPRVRRRRRDDGPSSGRQPATRRPGLRSASPDTPDLVAGPSDAAKALEDAP